MYLESPTRVVALLHVRTLESLDIQCASSLIYALIYNNAFLRGSATRGTFRYRNTLRAGSPHYNQRHPEQDLPLPMRIGSESVADLGSPSVKDRSGCLVPLYNSEISQNLTGQRSSPYAPFGGGIQQITFRSF
jgi:hypothetical protein